MILLLLFLLIPSTLSIELAGGTCMDAPFVHKFSSASSCSSPYILNSASPSFPTNLIQGTTKMTIDFILKINMLCVASNAKIDIFRLTIDTVESGKVTILNVYNDNDATTPKYHVVVNYGGGDVSLYNPTRVINLGDAVGLFMKMDLSRTANANARSIFQIRSYFYSDSTTVAKMPNTNWKFDSSTTFSFCADSSGNPTAYCEILGFSTWYVFETAANGAYYSAGLYPVIKGLYKLDEGSGYILHDSIGNIGTAYLGSSTASTSPIWQPSESSLKFNSANQYITLPAFSFPSGLASQRSFSLSFFMKITAGSSGNLFQYLSSDLSQTRASVTLEADGSLTGTLGGQATSPVDSQKILPATWYQVTITFISAPSPYRTYCSLTLGANMIANIYGNYPQVAFDSTDKVFIGKFTLSSSIQMNNLRIFIPGVYIVTNLKSCSYPAIPESCGVALGVPNPDNCVACPTGSYMKNNICIQNCYFYSDDGCRLKCPYPYTPRNETRASYCDFKCDSSSFLYPNGSCISTCSSPLVKYQNLSTEWYCRGPCSDSSFYYYPDQKMCMSYCTQAYNEDFSLFYPQCLPAKTSETIKSTIDVTEKAGTASRAVTQVTTVLSSGSPTGVSTSVAGKIFSNIKYLNISYSVGLQEALLTWKSNFINLEFMPDMPVSIQNNIVSQPVPYMFEKYDVESSFLLNFWNNIMLLVFLAMAFFVIRAIEFLIRSKYSEKMLNRVIFFRAMLQNFLLSQLYSVYGDVLFYSTIEYRSIDLREGLTSISFSSGIILTLIILASLVLHFFFLRKYQKIKKTQSNPELLDRFIKSNEGNFVLFRDFKDRLLIQQSFLLLLTARDLAFSLIITTLLRHPLAQCIIILILNLLMIAYLLLRSPFVSLFDSIQQFFYEFITLTVSVNVLILAILDAIASRGKELRNNIGTFIIIVNMCFNFGALGFMLVKGYLVVKEMYDEYQAKKKLKSNIKIKHQRPESRGQNSSQRASIDQTSSNLTEGGGDLRNSTLVKDIEEDLNESAVPFSLVNQRKKKKILRKEKCIENKDDKSGVHNNLEVLKVQDLEMPSLESKDSSSSWTFKGIFPQPTFSSNPLASENKPFNRRSRLQDQEILEETGSKNLEASDL